MVRRGFASRRRWSIARSSTGSPSRRQPERPFFAFVNYYDVHYPYTLPEGSIHRFGGKASHRARDRSHRELEDGGQVRRSPREEIAFVRDAYDDCIADLDEQLGRLLDELGAARRPRVDLADHHLGPRRELRRAARRLLHGTSLYQPQLHVPLVIVPPLRSPRPSRPVVSENVSVRDLPATVVDLLVFETGAPFPGESLARLWDKLARGGQGRSAGFAHVTSGFGSGPDQPS